MPPGDDETPAAPAAAYPAAACPDLPALGRLLRRLEADAERDGWHESAVMSVFVIYDHHDVVTDDLLRRVMARMGAPVRTARYTAQPMLPRRVFAQAVLPQDTGPHVGLRRFVMNLAYADSEHGDEVEGGVEAMRDLLRVPGLVAFAACYEAWGQRNLAPQALRGAISGGGHLRDLPDSQEVRLVMAVDAQDRVHRVLRVRGEPAELLLSDDGRVRGDVSTSLRILMDTAYDRLPGTPEAFGQRYPTLLQSIDPD
jgi:hypothetical protein